MLVAMPIGWSCFRLKGHSFAMATIAVGEVFQILFTNWKFAGGAVGLSMPPKDHDWWKMNFSSKELYYYIALGLLVFSLLVNVLIEKSFVGYYLRSIKDEPDAARSLGVGLARYKQIIYGLLILGIAVFYPTGIVGFFRSYCATRKVRKQAKGGEA